MNVSTRSEGLQDALRIAKNYAREYHNEAIDGSHLLRALMHKELGLRELLESLKQDHHYIAEWAEVRMEDLPKTGTPSSNLQGNEALTRTVEEADNVRLRLGLDLITPTCLLAAMCKPGVAFSPQQLKSFPLREHDILDLYLKEFDLQSTIGNSSNSTMGAEKATGAGSASAGALYRYCTDKTSLAREGKLDPVFGRDREVRMMTEVLARRTKPNVLLIGEPGVGKTALVDAFARNIAAGKVPERFRHHLLLELNIGTMLSGAAYKGEVEDRLKSIVSEVKHAGNIILFIDELHMLLDTKNPLISGAGNTLKPELARGELTVIGATTLEEYRKIIEPEKAFNRRFETITVQEPDEATCVRMLRAVLPGYEAHHGISVEKDAVIGCVRLARRYMKDKRLPDAALDLLDRTMASVKLTDEVARLDLEELTGQFEQAKELPAEEEEQVSEKTAEYSWLHNSIQSRISPILLGALGDETDFSKLTAPADQEAWLERTLKALQELAQKQYESVGKAEIAAVVAHKTGIPVGKLQSGEKERMLNMEDYLKKRLVGQDHTLKVISEAVMESRSGIRKAGQPVGSFFFLGPTGTGKTELAKALAEFLFNDEKAMIRFDMSEFKEEHSAALLYGAPPGYVGYEEGGLLVNQIRQKPYAVVLFDEIEKAHHSVFDIFLQIMDEGVIHDKLGKEGDFSNAIIIFTSNIASQWIIERFDSGTPPAPAELMEKMAGHFRPEFLARLTEIIPFRAISEEMAVRIFGIQMRSLVESLHNLGVQIQLSEEVKKSLAMDGFDSRYGARQISGVIRNRLRRPISRLLITGTLQKGDILSLEQTEDGHGWRINDKPLPAAEAEEGGKA